MERKDKGRVIREGVKTEEAAKWEAQGRER